MYYGLYVWVTNKWVLCELVEYTYSGSHQLLDMIRRSSAENHGPGIVSDLKSGQFPRDPPLLLGTALVHRAYRVPCCLIAFPASPFWEPRV